MKWPSASPVQTGRPARLAPQVDTSETKLLGWLSGLLAQDRHYHSVMATLTASENITLPLDIAGRAVDREWLDQVVETVGLAGRLKHRPSELSGGQQQRVAVARALAARPEIIFGDEPTGNLDSRSGAEVLGFLRRSVDELGQTFVMVTHDPSAAAYADRVLFLADGRIVDDMSAPTADKVLDRMRQFDSHGHNPFGHDPRGGDAAAQR